MEEWLLNMPLSLHRVWQLAFLKASQVPRKTCWVSLLCVYVLAIALWLRVWSMEWQLLSIYLFLLHSLLPLLQRSRTTSCLLCFLRLSHGAWPNIQYECANSRGRKGGKKGGKWKGEREGWRVREKRKGRKGRKRRRGEQRCSSPGNITFLWACTLSSLSLPCPSCPIKWREVWATRVFYLPQVTAGEIHRITEHW